MNPVITTMRYLIDGEVQPDPIEVLWTGSHADTGEWVSLITGIPGSGYVIVRHDHPFVDGQAFNDDGNLPMDFLVSLNRPDAGQLAVVLITALIDGSESLINSFVEERMARR